MVHYGIERFAVKFAKKFNDAFDVYSQVFSFEKDFKFTVYKCYPGGRGNGTAQGGAFGVPYLPD